MKQRTISESSHLVSLHRPHLRRRLFNSLRPEGATIPFDIDLIEVMADLDPGMVDWEEVAPRFSIVL